MALAPVAPRSVVRKRSHDEFGTDIARRTGAIIDNDLFSESLRQRLSSQARDDVGRETGWKTYD